MSRTRHIPQAMGMMALPAAALVLASCGSMPLQSLFSRAPSPPVRPVIMAPAETREIPVQEPTVALPAPMNPSPPVVASAMPPRPQRPPTPIIKPPPPVEVDAVALTDLVGSDFSSVLQVLRRPDNVEESSLSVVWTYQTECRLQLYFYPDIKTKVFRLLKYDLKDSSGERPANSNACMRSIMVAKNDEPASP